MRLKEPADGDIGQFFDRLYSRVESGGSLEVRCLSDTKPARSEWFAIPDCAGLWRYASLAGADGYDVFFGVNPRVRGGQDDNDVLAGVALWADIDGIGEPEAAEAKLEELFTLPIAPDAAVYSGNGLHVYSFLKAPIDSAGEDWGVYCRALKRYANLLGGDEKCVNPGRVLRFPGSFSHKRKRETLLWRAT